MMTAMTSKRMSSRVASLQAATRYLHSLAACVDSWPSLRYFLSLPSLTSAARSYIRNKQPNVWRDVSLSLFTEHAQFNRWSTQLNVRSLSSDAMSNAI